MVSLERLLANERTEDLRAEARVWHLERRRPRRSPERRLVLWRVMALLGRRRSARKEAAVFGSANRIEE